MHRYEQLNCIGHGSYGTVYKCRLRGTGQYVALKVISLLGKSKEEKEQLQNEISLVQSLDHANVIKYYETFLDDQMLCIASELCSSDLFEVLQGGSLNTQELKKVAREVLNGLEYLHNHRVAHRDVKPNNVLISPAGNLKLADFGFAKQFSETTINMRSIKGSPLYLAPEVARGLPYTAQADLWSFGVMMYELAAQRPPIIASDYIQLLKILQKDDLEVNYDLDVFLEDPVLKDLIDQCLQLNPDKRATTATLLKHSYLSDKDSESTEDQKQQKQKQLGWFIDLKASTFQDSYYQNINHNDAIEQNNSQVVQHNEQNQEIEQNEQQVQEEHMQSINDNNKQQIQVQQSDICVDGSQRLDNDVTLFEVLNDLLCKKTEKLGHVVKVIKNDHQQQKVYDMIKDRSLDVQQAYVTQLLHNFQDTNIIISFFEGLQQQVIKKSESYISKNDANKAHLVRLLQDTLHYLKAANVIFMNKGTHSTPILFGNKPTYPFDLWIYGGDNETKQCLGSVLERLSKKEIQYVYKSMFSMCINTIKLVNQYIEGFDNGERLCSLSCVLMIQQLLNQAFICSVHKPMDVLDFEKALQQEERQIYESINKLYKQNVLSEDKIDVIRYLYDYNIIILSDQMYKFLKLFIKYSFQQEDSENQMMSLQEAISKGCDTVQTQMINNLYGAMNDKQLNIPQFVYDLENQLFGGKYLNSTNVLIQLCKYQQMIMLSNFYQYEWAQCADIIFTNIKKSKLAQSLSNTQVQESNQQYSWVQLLDKVIQCVDREQLNDFLIPKKQLSEIDDEQANMQQEIEKILNSNVEQKSIIHPQVKQTLSKIKLYFTNFRRGYAQLMQQIAFSGLIAVSNKQQQMLQERTQSNQEQTEEQKVEYQIFLIQEQLYNISLDSLQQMFSDTLNLYVQFPQLGKINYRQHIFNVEKLENARKDQEVQQQLNTQGLQDLLVQLDNIEGIQRHNLVLTANVLTECYQKINFDVLSGIKQYSYNAIGSAIQKNFYTQHIFFTFMNTIQRQIRFALSYGLLVIEKILMHQLDLISKQPSEKGLSFQTYQVKQSVFDKSKNQILQIISIAQNANKYVCGLIMKTMIPVSNTTKLSFLTLLIIFYNSFSIPEEENLTLLQLIVNSFDSNPQESFVQLQNDMKNYTKVVRSQQSQLLDLLIQKILVQSNNFVHKNKLDQLVTFKFNSSFKNTNQIPLQTSTGCNITINGQLDVEVLQQQNRFFMLACKLLGKLTTTKILKSDIQIQQFVLKNLNLIVLQILKFKNQQLDIDYRPPEDAILVYLMQILTQYDPSIQLLSKISALALLQFNINTKHRQLVSCYKACHSDSMQIECAASGCVQCTVSLNQADPKQEQFIQEPIYGIIDCRTMIYYCQMIDQVVKEERINSLNIQEVISLLCMCLTEEFIQQELVKHQQNLVEQIISLIVTTIFNIGSKCTNVSLFLATIIDYEFIYNVLHVCMKYIYKNATKVVLFSVLAYITGQQSPLGKILVNQAIQCGILSPGYINYLLAKETLISSPGYVEYMIQILNNVYFQSQGSIRGKYKNILTQDFFDIILQITSPEAKYSLFQLVATLLQFSNDFLGRVASVIECGWLILKSKGSMVQQMTSIIMQMIRNSILSSDLYTPTVISQLPLLTTLLDSKEYDINIKSKIIQVFDILLTHVGSLDKLREQKVNNIITTKVIQLNQISEQELVETEQTQVQHFKAVLQSVAEKKLFTPEQEKIILKYVK